MTAAAATIQFFLTISYAAYFPLSLHPQPAYYLIALLFIQCIFWNGLFAKRSLLPIWAPVASFIVAFLVCSHTPPVLEDDYFRYLWDGYQMNQTGRPYQSPPSDWANQSKSSEIESLRAQVNFPTITTIYPPLTQGIFSVLYFFSGPSPALFLWLQACAGFLFFGWGFHRLLRRHFDKQLNHQSTVFWLLLQHPLLMREWVQSGHFDIWLAGSVMWALSCSSPFLRALWLAIGASVKWAALPLMALAKGPRQSWGALLRLSTLALGLGFLLPWMFFLNDLPHYWQAMATFSGKWEMNSGVFRWFREGFAFLNFDPKVAGWLARFVVLNGWCACTLITLGKKDLRNEVKAFWILFLLVWLSPVANVWYFTWSLPLVVFLPTWQQKWMLRLYPFLAFSYAFYLDESPIAIERWWDIEHIFGWAVLGMVFYLPTRNSNQAANGTRISNSVPEPA